MTDKNHETAQPTQSLADRAQNRTNQPKNEEFRRFIGEDWEPRPHQHIRMDVADYTPARRATLAAAFVGECLVFPAGEPRVRSNDTNYRFRAHSAFSHLTGIGAEREPGAVLVLYPLTQASSAANNATHKAILYFHPRSSRSSEEFYADAQHGEFWVGARPSLEEMEVATGIRTKDIDTLRRDLSKNLVADTTVPPTGSTPTGSTPTGSTPLRIIPDADPAIEALVDELREQGGMRKSESITLDAQLSEAASELRLIKDAWEIEQMRTAVAATFEGFNEIIRSIPRATTHWRGERVIEGAFAAKAREEGNGLGYETIVASGNHANTLHWIDNNGSVRPGDLILVDGGVELDSLYTADITRTLPVSGTFTESQRLVYQAVLDACEAALAQAGTPGSRFRDVHHAAMEVIARRLAAWGLLPVDAETSLESNGGQYHRRWMPHGTSHHLGLDVHDCAQAKRELYQDALLQPGMVFTIEPGLYFRADDMKVPEQFRGIGVRIEDDIVITAHGAERISEQIPRTIDDVESWMAQIFSENVA